MWTKRILIFYIVQNEFNGHLYYVDYEHNKHTNLNTTKNVKNKVFEKMPANKSVYKSIFTFIYSEITPLFNIWSNILFSSIKWLESLQLQSDLFLILIAKKLLLHVCISGCLAVPPSDFPHTHWKNK